MNTEGFNTRACAEGFALALAAEAFAVVGIFIGIAVLLLVSI